MRKVALVTGGSSGIGFAVAVELASEYSIILLARDNKKLEHAKTVLEKLGVPVETISQDLVDSSTGLEKKIRVASLKVGGDGTINVLVHSAGVTIEEKARVEDEDSCFNTNVRGTRNIFQSCKNIVARNGYILVISSLSAFVPLPGISQVYGKSKRMTWKIAERWSEVYEKGGVSISIAFPPVVDTPMVQGVTHTAPIYRAFPWLTATETARTSLRGMFARNANIHFSKTYYFLAKASEYMPGTIATLVRVYIPLIVFLKGKKTKG